MTEEKLNKAHELAGNIRCLKEQLNLFNEKVIYKIAGLNYDYCMPLDIKAKLKVKLETELIETQKEFNNL